MQPLERSFNLLLGLSVLSWALFGIAFTADLRPIAVRAVIGGLHLIVGLLILFRSRVEQQGSPLSCLAAVPALLIGGWALWVAALDWNVAAQIMFAIGGGLASLSFLFLGRSFAILPARRGVATQGPFRIVRHPAYLGELLMIFGCFISAPAWCHLAPLICAIPFVGLRIVIEEKVMSSDEDYRNYASKVRWRLIPFIW